MVSRVVALAAALWAAVPPVAAAQARSNRAFQIRYENRTGGAHQTGLSLEGLTGAYRITIDGEDVGAAGSAVMLPMSGAPTAHVRIERR
jgi:hypothetical protein